MCINVYFWALSNMGASLFETVFGAIYWILYKVFRSFNNYLDMFHLQYFLQHFFIFIFLHWINFLLKLSIVLCNLKTFENCWRYFLQSNSVQILREFYTNKKSAHYNFQTNKRFWHKMHKILHLLDGITFHKLSLNINIKIIQRFFFLLFRVVCRIIV